MLAAASAMSRQLVVDSDRQVSEGLSGFAAVAADKVVVASAAGIRCRCTAVVRAADMSVVERRILFCIDSDL